MFLQIITILWWVIILIVFIASIKEIPNHTEKKIVNLDDYYHIIQKLRELSPRDFERYVWYIYGLQWYSILQSAQRRKV